MVADRTGLPSAVLFVLTGSGLAFLPGPTAQLEPEVVLELVIPPLLFAAALNASLVDIRSNLRRIASLSVGLVLATALAVGLVLDLTVDELSFAAALALGAAARRPTRSPRSRSAGGRGCRRG